MKKYCVNNQCVNTGCPLKVENNYYAISNQFRIYMLQDLKENGCGFRDSNIDYTETNERLKTELKRVQPTIKGIYEC